MLRAARRRALQVQLRHRDDRHQGVVEVVRNAAGERAQCLELLRMMQLMLQLAPLRLGLACLGDVSEDHEKMRGLTVLADEQPLAPLEDSYGAVRPDDA